MVGVSLVVERVVSILEEIIHFLRRRLAYTDVAPFAGSVRVVECWEIRCFGECQPVVVEDSEVNVVACVNHDAHDEDWAEDLHNGAAWLSLPVDEVFAHERVPLARSLAHLWIFSDNYK